MFGIELKFELSLLPPPAWPGIVDTGLCHMLPLPPALTPGHSLPRENVKTSYTMWPLTFVKLSLHILVGYRRLVYKYSNKYVIITTFLAANTPSCAQSWDVWFPPWSQNDFFFIGARMMTHLNCDPSCGGYYAVGNFQTGLSLGCFKVMQGQDIFTHLTSSKLQQ